MSGTAYDALLGETVYHWPVIEPAEYLDYSYDASGTATPAPRLIVGAPDINPVVEAIASAAVAIAPSGTGQLTAANLSVSGTTVTVWLSGGVPGRNYIVTIVAITTAGRTFEWPVSILVDPIFASYPVYPPPSPGFGTAVTWGAGSYFGLEDGSGYLLTEDGSGYLILES